MIVYTLGTIFFPFDRAVNWLETLLEAEIIVEPVILQHGTTPVANLRHPLLTSVRALSRSDMYDAVRQSSLVISHAGQGSTRMLAEMGACFVLLPRLQRYGEHVDNHQLLFARAVEKYGISHCTEFAQLSRYVQQHPLPFRGELFKAPSLTEHLIAQYATLELQK
ncbi:glycosyltransferase [Aliterella atlantica]|uniref:Glucosyl transferase n=1 Tax=Aliterella atlantica CENA595 TaxID=1618023 RepID=A0A0D8ZT02_9CYAN|nr:glycosyltransferase [Aliterella atlantica]KJH70356.1 glucosyl transferase [Aliterella atlantica CENA595]